MLWRALQEARTLDLPDWWVVSGAVYNSVWNAMEGKSTGYGIKDIDLFYFDPDTSWEAEDRVIRLAEQHFFRSPPVEVRNQARVHLWYEDRFGHPTLPLTDCEESLFRFASETHAVAVRLKAEDQIEVRAPFGLDALFEMRMVPNTRVLNRRTHEAKGARCQSLWPGIKVEPWPELTMIDSEMFCDWARVLELIRGAFAYMDGRIDPPSSMHRLTVQSIEQKAKSELCFLAHDGFEITGCVFCDPREEALYVGKLAVDPAHQGKGIGKALMARAEAEARSRGMGVLELETRIELSENHAAFARLGFLKTGESTHVGYEKATSIIMRKSL
ncbi:MAG: nucleotidyltransferase family protein [Pseudomonadota bacterium]